MSREGSHETGGNHGLDQQVRGMRHDPWAPSGVVKGPGSGQAWVQILSPPLTKLCDFGQITVSLRIAVKTGVMIILSSQGVN